MKRSSTAPSKTRSSSRQAPSKRKSTTPRKPRSKKGKVTWRQRGRQLMWRLLFGFFLIGLLSVGLLFAALDHQVRAKFEGRKWALAARVYARPLDLYVGKLLSKNALLLELQGLNYQKAPSLSQAGDMYTRGHRIFVFARSFRGGDLSLKRQRIEIVLEQGSPNQQSVAAIWALNAQGRRQSALDMVMMEPQEIGAIYPKSGEDRVLVQLHKIPPLLGETLIAVEDQNFAHHFGLSPKSIARAFVANVKAGSVVQGGSTISQQLVKNLFLTNEQRFWRKIREALMTLSLEWRYSKAEILETYLNEVFLGQRGARAIHGFALASRYYFGRPLQDLNKGQVALLVGLVKGASYYNPWRHPERAKKRRNLVLSIMNNSGLITTQDTQHFQHQPLGILQSPGSQHAFPGFIDLVKQQLKEEYREDDLRTQGLQIFTTLAPSVQKATENSLKDGIKTLEKQYQTQKLQGAIVVTAVGSGEILALTGNKNPHAHGFNRALNAKRPIGSLIKPAVYLTALQKGQTLASLIDDSPYTLKLRNGDVWKPRNFSRKSHGQIPLYQGLTYSYNQATARLGMELGLPAVHQTLKAMGVRSDLAQQTPALLLGALSLSPLEVSAMYHTIANDGVYTPLRSIRNVFTPGGRPLQNYPLTSDVRLNAEQTQLLQFALQTVMHQGTGRRAYQYLPNDIAVAGKTGTTNDQRDSWFAGFQEAHLGVVWVGRDDNQPTPLTGSRGALPIWGKLFQQLPAEGLQSRLSAQYASDNGIDYRWIDARSGYLSAEHCENAVVLPFIKGSEPSQTGACRRLATYQRERTQRSSRSPRESSNSGWKRIFRSIFKPYIRD